MQKSITLLSSFQATVQDYNKSHDIAAAREKGKMENGAILSKGLGTSKGLWLLLQKHYQVVKKSEGSKGFSALGPVICGMGNVPPDMRGRGESRGVIGPR